MLRIARSGTAVPAARRSRPGNPRSRSRRLPVCRVLQDHDDRRRAEAEAVVRTGIDVENWTVSGPSAMPSASAETVSVVEDSPGGMRDGRRQYRVVDGRCRGARRRQADDQRQLGVAERRAIVKRPRFALISDAVAVSRRNRHEPVRAGRRWSRSRRQACQGGVADAGGDGHRQSSFGALRRARRSPE